MKISMIVLAVLLGACTPDHAPEPQPTKSSSATVSPQIDAAASALAEEAASYQLYKIGKATDQADVPDEAISTPRTKPVTTIDLCWEGYCPCDPPQGGPDQLLCDQLRMGNRDPQMLSAGKAMREARRQIEEHQL